MDILMNTRWSEHSCAADYWERVVLFRETGAAYPNYGVSIEIERDGERRRYWGRYCMTFREAMDDMVDRFHAIERGVGIGVGDTEKAEAQ